MDRSLGIDLLRVIAASVCDHRLGYQHARRTHTFAAFNFLHHIFADDLQQTLFTFEAKKVSSDPVARRTNFRSLLVPGLLADASQHKMFSI